MSAEKMMRIIRETVTWLRRRIYKSGFCTMRASSIQAVARAQRGSNQSGAFSNALVDSSVSREQTGSTPSRNLS
ncbi:MAG TPA: hypothetical protein VGP19_09610 [Candidatus Acidoferrales bacterium]|jgi:hypothetical protein|nr:hypothetical protein [Candidatus Acidoferrales bacterium]